MTAYILRRKNLGKGSTNGILKYSKSNLFAVRNDDKIPQNPELMCIRWGCTSGVPQKNVLNKAESIHLVSDKSAFRWLLQAKKLCPQTWWQIDKINQGDLPIIVRPQVHSQGKQLWFCRTMVEVMEATRLAGPNWYASKFIDKIAEYRVFCGGGRVICVAQKTPADAKAVAWNVAQGGKFENVRWENWPLRAVKTALEAYELSGLDFGGVDVMVDNLGCVFVLEINSAPSLTSPYRMSCFAKYLDYTIMNGKAKILMIPDKGGYRKFIHPAITEGARI